MNLLKTSGKQSGVARNLESVKQLYYVVTTKQLFLEWLLEINLYIGGKLTRSLAVEEINEYAEVNDSIDMRTAPVAVKRNIKWGNHYRQVMDIKGKMIQYNGVRINKTLETNILPLYIDSTMSSNKTHKRNN